MRSEEAIQYFRTQGELVRELPPKERKAFLDGQKQDPERINAFSVLRALHRSPIKEDEDARAQFEVARVRMYKIGAVDLMRTVAPLLPSTTLTVIDDYDQAGGKGFAPSVTLRGPERTIDISKVPFSRGEEIITLTEVDTLSIYPIVFHPLTVCISIWTERSKQPRDGQNRSLSSHMRWDSNIYHKKGLAMSIFEGVKQLGLPNTNLLDVKKALGLTTKPLTPKH